MSHVPAGGLPHVWRTRLSERHGRRHLVTARGRLISVTVELAGGFRALTARGVERRAR